MINNVKHEVIKIPFLQELLAFVRPIKVRNPNKKKFFDDLRISYSLKNFRYLDKNIDDKIEYNDVVELSSVSDNNKFNSDSIWLTVGRNAFDEDFEKNILGLKANETKNFKIGEDEVRVKIKTITKKYYGEVSIEDIKDEHPDATSVEEFFEQQYKDKCDELLDERINNLIVKKLCFKLYELSDIKFDDDELKSYVDERYEFANKVVIPEGIPEEYRKIFDITPKESKVKYIDGVNFTLSMFSIVQDTDSLKELPESDIDVLLIDAIKKELLCRTINQEFAKSVDYKPTEESYNKYIAECAKHAKCTEEDYIKSSGYTYEIYADSILNIAGFYYFKDYALQNLIKN